ncbi:1-aminocyclopropane-1-carboxylate deaminase/D-cysteine desulfhydrase [Thermoflavimicrobium dichotomicum]|uniref:D-cysteine desulfhydrase n=1 Tax=Thermoflavimicrobium dichotomicum TaxID=46223 RepID=A0A1I3SNY7_9BACL|nr:D-cysteine desulfhydrase family protein [Thermoflavimicrobium dichotomicum]SFJ59126.1 D-cysteine desulfhydrase [Thermoflavimicrobium dichotomicum]
MRVFSRYPLLLDETPLHPLPRLADKLGVASCWIKRDDLTGIAFGGNKVRKLEYLIGQARQEGCNLIITGGSPGSNHCRLTAAVANQAGMQTWLCFSGHRLGERQGNLFLDELLEAKIFLTGQYGSKGLLQAMEEKAEEARQLGYRPFVIPVGGSVSIGDYGYYQAWQELESQRERLGLPPFDEIYVAVGTGGTLAGLLAGQAVHGQDHTRMIGVSVWLDQKSAKEEVHRLAHELLGEIQAMKEISHSDIEVLDQYIGRKYGVPSPAGNEAIRLLAKLEGIFVDPIYTGKALAGMIDHLSKRDMANKHVLFWHTGGTPALFAHVSSFFPVAT